MKNNNKFRLDVWGAITLGTIALYVLFLLYPMAYLIRQSVMDPDTGGFTLAYFTKFFSKSYYFDTLINSFKGPSQRRCSPSPLAPHWHTCSRSLRSKASRC